MTNKQIASAFNDLARIMELHDENVFKIRSYQNAYLQLRKHPNPLIKASREELESIKGVGKNIADKIQELLESGTLKTFEKYFDQTPSGVVEMLQIRGIGPKKIRALWKDLGVESVGELKYACVENRLVELKGFGIKTQEDLLKKLEYFQSSKGLYHFASLEKPAINLLAELKGLYSGELVSFCGAFRRKAIILSSIDFITSGKPFSLDNYENLGFSNVAFTGKNLKAQSSERIPIHIFHAEEGEFGTELIRRTGSLEFVDKLFSKFGVSEHTSENAYFDSCNLPYIVPELRDNPEYLEITPPKSLIEEKDIEGIVHVHTSYSDGLQSVLEMASEAQKLGYSYIAITDHSKSAVYAGGLSPEKVLQQFAEIDALNNELENLIIFKGIESDILTDGSLDYEDSLLSEFDLVIASIHSNLKMDLDKATNRLIKAIENPYTTILGHPTGRLLLSREGYPIDHKKIIDACAANGVAIEINANPYRLDIDWKWIPLAIQKGIMISVNPDAHSISGILDTHFGVLASRKGGLTKEACLNALEVNEFRDYILSKKSG